MSSPHHRLATSISILAYLAKRIGFTIINCEYSADFWCIFQQKRTSASGGQPRTRDMMGPINTEEHHCCDCVVDGVILANDSSGADNAVWRGDDCHNRYHASSGTWRTSAVRHVCATCQLNNPLIYTRGSPCTWATDDDDP